MEHHVNWSTSVGTRVLINDGWYYAAIIRSFRPESTRASSSSRGIVRLFEHAPLLMWFEQANRSAPRGK